jgi:hypothetical protein
MIPTCSHFNVKIKKKKYIFHAPELMPRLEKEKV